MEKSDLKTFMDETRKFMTTFTSHMATTTSFMQTTNQTLETISNQLKSHDEKLAFLMKELKLEKKFEEQQAVKRINKQKRDEIAQQVLADHFNTLQNRRQQYLTKYAAAGSEPSIQNPVEDDQKEEEKKDGEKESSKSESSIIHKPGANL